jgi:hypothetical protein
MDTLGGVGCRGGIVAVDGNEADAVGRECESVSHQRCAEPVTS